MRLLVCGDREWAEADRPYLYAVLDAFQAKHGVEVLIDGAARGADTQAHEWAVSRGVPFRRFPAEWEKYKVPGRRNPAGPIRNRQMLSEGKPQYVLAFHRRPWLSKGTRDMVKIAREAGIPANWLPKYEETQMPEQQPPETKVENLPGGVIPDRTAVPDASDATARDTMAEAKPGHKDVNTVAGLADPDAEAKAPGRTTHGATNNP